MHHYKNSQRNMQGKVITDTHKQTKNKTKQNKKCNSKQPTCNAKQKILPSPKLKTNIVPNV